MPIFEYRCRQCGAEFEELTLSRTNVAVACRECGGKRVTRLLSAFAVGSESAPAPDPGPCGDCGAAQRGMCGVDL